MDHQIDLSTRRMTIPGGVEILAGSEAAVCVTESGTEYLCTSVCRESVGLRTRCKLCL